MYEQYKNDPVIRPENDIQAVLALDEIAKQYTPKVVKTEYIVTKEESFLWRHPFLCFFGALLSICVVVGTITVLGYEKSMEQGASNGIASAMGTWFLFALFTSDSEDTSP